MSASAAGWSWVEAAVRRLLDSLVSSQLLRLERLASNLSEPCTEALWDMLRELRRGRRSAMHVLDASGKLPGGVLEGTLLDLGSFDECLEAGARYCLVGYRSSLLLDASAAPEWIAAELRLGGAYMRQVAMWLGTCVPANCSETDMLALASAAASPLRLRVEVADCQAEGEPHSWPVRFEVALVFLGLLAAACLVGTVLDVVARFRILLPPRRWTAAARAFSLWSNAESLLSVDRRESLGFLSGIRFVSASWVVLGHTYFYTDAWKYLKYRRLLGLAEQFDAFSLASALVDNFTIPVGSFFVVSGFLAVYAAKADFRPLLFLARKWWRMTPVLALTMACFVVLPLTDSGPLWRSTLEPPLAACADSWWRSALYVSNWWNSDRICLLHTWYLSALMQFHCLAALVLFVFRRGWPRAAVALGALVAAGCLLWTFWLAWSRDFPMPAPGRVRDPELFDRYNSEIYVKPFPHAVSYLAGMAAGAVARHGTVTTTTTPRWWRKVGCVSAVFAATASVLGIYSPWGARALYISAHRLGWALAVSWLMWYCATESESAATKLLSLGAALGRLSFLAYMLHPLVILYRNASLRERAYYGRTEMMFTYFANLLASYLLAFLGYVAVEKPFALLEQMLLVSKS